MSSHHYSLAVATALAIAAPAAAHAHVTFEKSTIAADRAEKLVLRVPHGCDGKPTNVVRVAVPEGAIDVKPMPKAGWELSVVKGPLAKTYQLHGKPVSEGVKEIVWSKGDLADDFYDEFVFRARFVSEMAGQTIAAPVVQECGTAKAAWTDIAKPGEDPHKLKSPAPTLKIVAQAAAAAPKAFKAGAITVESPWTRATPAGAKVGGGYFIVRNGGSAPDKLIGVSSAISERGEVHEMTMSDGVMKMREIKGIDIAPGASVELKPGGLHVMFIGLKSGLVAGAPVKARLKFEKAGEVDVEFAVAPLGASGAPAGEHSHH